MRPVLVALLLLTACNDQGEERSAVEAPAPAAVPPTDAQSQAALLPVPEDPAQLKRLVSMGYTPHEGHMHAPGVTACPKMGENPVM